MSVKTEQFRFGHFLLDTRKRTLTAHGTKLPVGEPGAQILEALICHRDRDPGLSADEIIDLVYGRAVGRGIVPVYISKLRQAIRQHEGDPEIIRTIGSRYRFEGELLPEPEAPVSIGPDDAAVVAGGAGPASLGWSPWAPRSTRRRIGAATRALAVLALVSGFAGYGIWHRVTHEAKPPALSIAVLPFKTDGLDKNEEILADVIAGDLTTDLGHLPNSQVTAGESTDIHKATSETKQQIGRHLNVHYLVWGNLTNEGDSYRLAVHLNDTDAGYEVWGKLFPFKKGQMADLRRTIVGVIANSINLGIDELISNSSLHDRPNNPTALDLYYRARFALDVEDIPETYQRAEAWLRQAIEKQPDFSDALAELGWVLLRDKQLFTTDASASDPNEAANAIELANRLSPHNTTAIAAKALALEMDGRCPEAEHVAKEALDIQASNIQAQAVLTGCSWLTGDLALAKAHLDTLAQINPDGHGRLRRDMMQANIDLLTGHADQAIPRLEGVIADYGPLKGVARPMGGPEFARILLMQAYAGTGQLDKANLLFRDYNETFPNRSVWRIAVLQSRALFKLEEKSGILNLLHDAGMAWYGNEDAAHAGVCSADSDAFSATPMTLPNGETLTTNQMLELTKTPSNQVVIDTGSGAAPFPGAIWYDHGDDMAETHAYVAKILAGLTPAERDKPIIFMDNGPFGCGGFLAASELAARRKLKIEWYRGGEEAWAHSGGPQDDRRPY